MIKAVVITGANGGIGLALCQAFFDNGYHVIATDIHSIQHNRLICNDYFSADLSKLINDIQYQKLIFSKIEHLISNKSLNCLVNNAAIQIIGKTLDLDLNDWQLTMNVNLLAPFVLIKKLSGYLEKSKGSVINISSIHARLTKPGFVAYSTSKAALSALTKSMAVDFRSKIRINAIEPAAIKTNMLLDGFGGNKKAVEVLKQHHPYERLGYPTEIANLALFLASNEANFLHGCCVDIGGGISSVLHDPN